MTGAAYTAGQGMFLELIIPTINKAAKALEDLKGQVKRYEYYDKQVGNEFLDEDQLEKQLQALQNHQSALISQIDFANSEAASYPNNNDASLTYINYGKSLTWYKGINEAHIQKVEEDLRKLRQFDKNVDGLFTANKEDLKTVMEMVFTFNLAEFDKEGNFVLKPKNEMDYKRVQAVLEGLKEQSTNLDNFQLPQEYADRVQAIINGEGSAEDKAKKIARVYEEYLYSLNKEAFDKYDLFRAQVQKDKNNFEISEKEANIKIAKADKELAKELQNIPINILAVTRSLGDDMFKISDRSGWNYLQFANMVNTKHPLDLKNRKFGKAEYSIWARQWRDYKTTDYPGNYLSGYYGQGYFKVGDESLKIAAGEAQKISDWKNFKFDNLIKSSVGPAVLGPIGSIVYWWALGYGDNPEDGKMIQDGIDDYKKYN